jgi:hypothetical protein
MDVMVDLETLGTATNTIILTVAAVYFNPKNGSIGDKFYEKIIIDSYKDYPGCFSFDGSTISWWILNVTDEARKEAFSGTRYPLKIVMEKLHKWLTKTPFAKIWSHGASFDIPILTHTFKVLNLETPWKYWNIRDTRTIYDLKKIDLKNISIPGYPLHHALGDCLRQIEGLKRAFSAFSEVQNNNILKVTLDGKDDTLSLGNSDLNISNLKISKTELLPLGIPKIEDKKEEDYYTVPVKPLLKKRRK